MTSADTQPMGTKPQVKTRSDRDLQDALITYLGDANLRRTAAAPLPLSPDQAQRAEKFARFLARRYYRDRLARSFRYSRRFAPSAESVVDLPPFDQFLGDCVLGSLAAAERVADLALSTLRDGIAPGPWWSSLLEYERAFFLQAATTEMIIAGQFPRAAVSALCCRFSWNLPQLLLRLKAEETIGDDLPGEVTLLFSRTPHGRIYVAEVDPATAAVFHAADGRRSPAAIAESTSLSLPVVEHILGGLEELGALVTSSEK